MQSQRHTTLSSIIKIQMPEMGQLADGLPWGISVYGKV